MSRREPSEASPPLLVEPVPLRVRASWHHQVLAESDAAVRIEYPGGPLLAMPVEDVDFGLFADERRSVVDPVLGQTSLWSLGVAEDIHSVLRVFTLPSTTAPSTTVSPMQSDAPHPLVGYAAFDHQRVVVELVEFDPRVVDAEASVVRFPPWGDASDLIDLLDVHPAGAGAYESVVRGRSQRRRVVEGSQIVAQALVAANRHVPDRRVVSGHFFFLRAADVSEPLRFELEELQSGRTFVALAIHVSQSGRQRASGILLLATATPDVVRHEDLPPDVAGPYEADPYDMAVTGRDIRIVDAAYDDDPDAPAGPPVIDAWVRFRDVPDDPALHTALLAQFTGHLSIAAALRPHSGVSQRMAHRTLSTGVNAIGIAFHADVRADRWMLYHHHSTFAGDGMTHATCRVHGEDGSLLASFTVDAMVRPFEGAPVADERTAL